LIPNITRGGSMGGLVGYVGGKGERNEHVNPRVITGSASVQLRTGYRVVSIERPGARRELTALLDAPHIESGRQAPVPVKDRAGTRIGTRDGHVWHCSLSLPANEPVSDSSAADIAQRFIEQMKLDECEWAAIRHDSKPSKPHLHLVVNVVKPDGRLASTNRDYSRAQAACARITSQLGLTELQGQQRHLPKSERTQGIAARPLTGRYKRLHNKIAKAASTATGLEQLPAKLKRQGVLWRQTKHEAGRHGISFAEIERPDIWLKGTDIGWKEHHLITAVKNNTVRAEAERQAAQIPKLAPAVARPFGGYQPPGAGLDSGIGR
jgi:Relaxase/Mobilisation nuclease domain